MASNKAPIQNTPAASSIDDYTKGWEEDVRSLPMYNVRECVGGVCGYLVDAQILQAAGGTMGEEQEGNRAFSALVVKLTRPCMALVNGERQTIAAGAEIFVHAAALEDLYRAALDPNEVTEYALTPELDAVTGLVKQIKLKNSSFTMPIWKRLRNPNGTKPRAEITRRKPSIHVAAYARALSMAKTHGPQALLEMTEMTTPFEAPRQMSSAASAE